jgi:hypothetical protein
MRAARPVTLTSTLGRAGNRAHPKGAVEGGSAPGATPDRDSRPEPTARTVTPAICGPGVAPGATVFPGVDGPLAQVTVAGGWS